MRAIKDRYGFTFWLRWILLFVGSFVAAVVFWTWFMQKLFGEIFGAELTMTWIVSVFGSWFLLVIPFMRKKEQIWKRLNDDQERSVDAWFNAMSLFIGLLVISLFFWTWKMSAQIDASPGMQREWLTAVFVSWLVVVFPFLIYMYRQADKIFLTAKERQVYAPKFRSLYVESARRVLPESIQQKLEKVPTILRDGHLVNATLRNGTKINNLFVFKSREILGVYDQTHFDFSAQDIVEVEPLPKESIPALEEGKWLRIDQETS